MDCVNPWSTVSELLRVLQEIQWVFVLYLEYFPILRTVCFGEMFCRGITLIVLAQTTNFCPTAIWNNTFNVIAGISGLASSGATTFNGPHDLAFGPGNTMFVADYYNNRVQRFVGGSMTATTVPNLTINYPSSIHVDGNGVLFVLDLLNYRVLRWFNNVAILAAAGRGAGSSLSQISTSYGLAVDSNSNIYVSDCGNNRVTFWTAGNPNISVVVRFVLAM